MDRRGLNCLGGLGLAALGLSGCSGGAGGARVSDGPRPRSTVLDVVRGEGLSRFLRAAETAELTETLAGSGPFTLFAPTDRAFAASETARLDAAGMRRLVAYHVVPGQLTADFLEGMDMNHATLLGSSLNVDGTGPLRVNGASVVRSNLMASNGVVFVIDRVLSPR